MSPKSLLELERGALSAWLDPPEVLTQRLFMGTHFETGVTFQDVSTGASDSDHDACPNCGTRVESAISAPGEPLREATQRRCPNCGKVLRREVGGEWTIDESAR